MSTRATANDDSQGTVSHTSASTTMTAMYSVPVWIRPNRPASGLPQRPPRPLAASIQP